VKRFLFYAVLLHPSMDRLLPPSARIEKIGGGFAWLEGPVWNAKAGYLLFSDIPSNAVFRWTPDAGASLYLKPSGRKTTLADRYHASRLNSPNDLVYRRNSDLYFTDPRSDCPAPSTTQGNLWAAGPGGIHVLSAAGKHLGLHRVEHRAIRPGALAG
jgi:sugar lactone lactonase YvrE